MLKKKGTGNKLTPDSTLFLDRRLPAYMGSVLGFLHAPKFIESFQHLTDAVRKGGTVAGEAGTVAPEHPLWGGVCEIHDSHDGQAGGGDRPFVPTAASPAAKKVLNTAGWPLGSSGIPRSPKRLPEAEIVALDWPNVLAVAQELARGVGVQSRYRTIAGDAFQQDLGTGC